jgi:hypothetical protein
MSSIPTTADNQEPIVDKNQLLQRITNTQALIQKDPESLKKSVFSLITGFSELALAYKDQGGKEGWSSGVKTNLGNFTPANEQLLSSVLKNVLNPRDLSGNVTGQTQTGGDNPQLRSSAQSDYVVTALPIPISDISLDNLYYGIKERLHGYDASTREIAKIVGSVALVNNHGDIQIGPVGKSIPAIPISKNLILPFINAILETIRLIVTFGPIEIPLLRKLNSLTLALLDLSRGEWKDSLLSFLGFFSRDWLLTGLILKTFRWVYNFIAPDIQDRLEDSAYAASKSALLGFWIYIISITAPNEIRTMFNNVADTARIPIEEFNKEIDELEKTAQASGIAKGGKITFPRISMDRVPSFDDLQNLQSVLKQPEIFCNPVTQKILGPMMEQPALRLVLELMDVPTIPEKRIQHCKDQNGSKSVIDSLAGKLQPTIIPQRQGTQVGGNKSKKQSKHKHKKSKSERRPRTLMRLF